MCKKHAGIKSKRSRLFWLRLRLHPLRRRKSNSISFNLLNKPPVSMSKHTMKKFSVIPLIAALAVFVSCQKQPTEEERKAEVERQVQERLATERSNAEKERLAQQQAELAQREKAAASDKDTIAPTAAVAEQPALTAEEPVETEKPSSRSENGSTATYGMFYEKLDPYGEWRETNEYGYVWQPREAESSRDWKPYTEGHWVYSDAGWTWVSDEPFGWATYHFGRWVRLRRIGWVWVPGEEWAPAWVSWRTNKDYVGWAPLPPEARFDRRTGIHNWADNYYDIGPEQYSFVPSNEFGAEKIQRAVVPAERNITIVVETTNVTRITFSNTTIVNEGPNYEELRSRSQRPIERYRLRRERNLEGPARVRGAELEISVPILSDVHNVFRPRRVKERVTEVNVENGWTGVTDRSAAERARTKIRAEATPPPNAPPRKFVRPEETSAPAPSATAATTTAAPIAPANPSPTMAPSAAAAPANTPQASASPRLRPSPSVRQKPSPTPVPSPAASASITPPPTTAPASSPAGTVAEASPTVSPPHRLQPTASLPPRPVGTPPTVRRTMPPIPVITASPQITVAPTTPAQTVPKPAPTLTPAIQQPSAPPHTAVPTPTANGDTHRPPNRRDVPQRTMPPRLTPPPPATTAAPAAPEAASPTIQPSQPPAMDRGRNQQHQRHGPPNREAGTPTPSPSTPPN
jgi:hypothetical protein